MDKAKFEHLLQMAAARIFLTGGASCTSYHLDFLREEIDKHLSHINAILKLQDIPAVVDLRRACVTWTEMHDYYRTHSWEKK